MKKAKGPTLDKADLLHRAKERLARKKSQSGPPTSTEDAQRLIHELQVHQIELKLQNEKLRQTRQELEASLERYTDRYDFAPAAYFLIWRPHGHSCA